MITTKRHPLAKVLLLLGALVSAMSATVHADRIEFASVILRVIDEAEVSATEKGLLRSVNVTEGKLVEPGDVLAQLDDAEAALARDQAELEGEITRRQAEDRLEIEIAADEVRVAQADLDRARQSRERFRTSVSQSEIDHLETVVLQAQSHLKRANHDREIAVIKDKLQKKQLEFAVIRWERHQVKAPFAGVVEVVKRHAGEWVEPGNVVARVVRINRLRAEAFLHIKQLPNKLVGSPVTFVVEQREGVASYPGTVTFVGTEVDPVNEQVRVWAEIENPQASLRPGLRGKLTILAP